MRGYRYARDRRAAERRRKNGRPARECASFFFGSFSFIFLFHLLFLLLLLLLFLLLHFVRPLGGYGERFIATRLLAVATFCGFQTPKKRRFRNRRPDTGSVTRAAKCPLFLPSRGEFSDYAESHSEAKHRASRRVVKLSRRSFVFLLFYENQQ